MSLNGDVTVIRNGRSTSTVSIYNYPEHLNPFYEDDQHKRLRFWRLNKKGDGERRNSFSLGGMKDMWAFKSFRTKKKSSTLGINKTSESPPPLRREYQIDANNLFNSYDRRARYSSNGTATDENFQRNATYRSSLQNVRSTQDSPSGIGLNRNDQYRSTIQFGRNQTPKADGRPVPLPRRYVYGGSVTPQPSRNTEFSRGLSRQDSLTCGSSQNSISTNPFDSDDNDEENELHIVGSSSSLRPSAEKKMQRKKRRAPAPPVPTHSGNTPPKSSSQTNDLHQTELRIEENLEIANLTAEIESLTKNTNDDLSAPKPSISATQTKNETIKTNGTIPKEIHNLKSSSNSIITKEFKKETKPSQHELYINEEKSEIKPPLPEKMRNKTNQQNIVLIREEPSTSTVGNVECIHVHVDSRSGTPERALPSRVSSFKKEPKQQQSEQITAKTSFTLTSPPSNRREIIGNGLTKEQITTTQTVTTIRNETEPTSPKENGVVKEANIIVKPPIAAKPNVVDTSKPKVSQNFAVIHKPNRHMVLSSETERIAVPAPAPTTATVVIEKNTITESTSTPNSKEAASPKADIVTEIEIKSDETNKIKPRKSSHNQKHVVFQTDEHVVKTDNLTKIEKVDIPKPEPIQKTTTSIETIAPKINVKETITNETVENQPTEPPTTSSTSLKVIEPANEMLRIEESNTSDSSTLPTTSSNTASTSSSSSRIAHQINARDEFEALYRNRPISHLEWKQSTLAPLEQHVPPEKRRSVKDIIESINRSQRLLHAAANKDLPLLSTTSQMPPPAYSEVVNQPPPPPPSQSQTNGNNHNDLDQSLKSLDETQREIERIFEEITAQDNSEDGPSPSGTQNSNNVDIQKPNNEEVFKKCRVTKEVYDYRETSPTTSNLDWNPVPKPKRSKNLPEQREL